MPSNRSARRRRYANKRVSVGTRFFKKPSEGVKVSIVKSRINEKLWDDITKANVDTDELKVLWTKLCRPEVKREPVGKIYPETVSYAPVKGQNVARKNLTPLSQELQRDYNPGQVYKPVKDLFQVCRQHMLDSVRELEEMCAPKKKKAYIPRKDLNSPAVKIDAAHSPTLVCGPGKVMPIDEDSDPEYEDIFQTSHQSLTSPEMDIDHLLAEGPSDPILEQDLLEYLTGGHGLLDDEINDPDLVTIANVIDDLTQTETESAVMSILNL